MFVQFLRALVLRYIQLFLWQIVAAQNAAATTTDIKVGDLVIQGISPETPSLLSSSSLRSFPNTTSTPFSSSGTASSLPSLITTRALPNTSSSAIENSTITSWSSGLFKDEDVRAARSCWSDYSSWWMTYIAPCVNTESLCPTTVATTIDYIIATEPTTIYPSVNVSTYSLCDGYPRADYPVITTNITTTYTKYASTRAGAFLQPNGRPIPRNHCRSSDGVCGIVNYGSNIRSLALLADQDSPNAHNNSDLTQILTSLCGDNLEQGLPCLIQGGPAQLIYFPEQSNYCNSTNRTITPANVSSVITTLGTEFTSGTAYISFGTLYAAYQRSEADTAGDLQLGPTFSNTIFAFPSNQISTNCLDTAGAFGAATDAFGGGQQLNFADLNSPVPATAYQCQNPCDSVKASVCHTGSVGEEIITTGTTTYTRTNYDCVYSTELWPSGFCSTIWDNFNPLLAMPTRLRDLAPEWASCSFWHARQPNFVFDPPIRLQQASAVATPTHASIVSTTRAQAASTAKSILAPTAAPTQTSVAQESMKGSLPEDSGVDIPSKTSAPPVGPDPTGTASKPTSRLGSINLDPLGSAIHQITASSKIADPSSNAQGVEDSSTTPVTVKSTNPAQPSSKAGSTVGATTLGPSGTSLQQVPASSKTGDSNSPLASTIKPASDPASTVRGVDTDPPNSSTQRLASPSETDGQSGSSSNAQSTENRGPPSNSLESAGDIASPQGGTDNAQTLATTFDAGESTIGFSWAAGTTLGTGIQSIGAAVWTPFSGSLDSQATQQAEVTLGSTTLLLTRLGNGQVAVDGVTKSVGGLINVGGAVLSVQSSAVVVQADQDANPTTRGSQPDAGTMPIPAGGDPAAAESLADQDMASDSTLSLGGPPATINGATLSLGSGGIILDGITLSRIPSINTGAASTVVINPSNNGEAATATILPGGSVAVIGDTTIAIGDPAITVNGYLVSMASNALFVNGDEVLATPSMNSDALVITKDGNTATATILPGGSRAIIGGTTIFEGGPAISMPEGLVSMASNALILDGTTVRPTPSSADGALVTFAKGGESVTARLLPDGNVLILDGNTLSHATTTSGNTAIESVTAESTSPTNTNASVQTQDATGVLSSGATGLSGGHFLLLGVLCAAVTIAGRWLA